MFSYLSDPSGGYLEQAIRCETAMLPSAGSAGPSPRAEAALCPRPRAAGPYAAGLFLDSSLFQQRVYLYARSHCFNYCALYHVPNEQGVVFLRDFLRLLHAVLMKLTATLLLLLLPKSRWRFTGIELSLCGLRH